MEMADNPKLALSCGDCGKIEEKMGTQKISVSDHINGFQYKAEKSDDSFVIDMENFSSHANNTNNSKDTTPNSRIKLQRNLSRKGSQRIGGEKKINANAAANDSAASFSKGSGTPEKPVAVVAVGPADQPQVHHQITITSSSNITAASSAAESRFGLRRNSFKRPAASWAIDPKRVLLFFATLSSMGTILLIYFTLSMGKFNVDDHALD